MPRNLERRVEVTVPVLDPALCERLDGILATCLEDDVLAWELGGGRRVDEGRDGTRRELHERLMHQARAGGTEQR